jgi:hypothetical protein
MSTLDSTDALDPAGSTPGATITASTADPDRTDRGVSASVRATRRLSAVGLVVGAAAFGAADVLRRVVAGGVTDPAALAATVGRHTGAWSAAALLAVLGSMLLLPGLVSAMGLVHRRGVVLTVVGTGLTGLGAVAGVGHAVAFYADAGVKAAGGAPAAVVRALDAASERYPVLVLLIVAFAVGMTAGPLVLTIGLRRARLVPVWVPVAAVVFALCGSVGGVPAGVLGLVAALAVFAPISSREWRSADSAQ